MLELPYPKLFLRTALHIGAALCGFIFIGAASFGLIAAFELRGYIETRHSTLAQEAAAVLQDGGESALRNWLAIEAEIPADVSVFVLDEDSVDISGRELPEQYAEFIRTSVIGIGGQASDNLEPVRLAPKLTGPDGRAYYFLVLPKGIDVWGSPATLMGLLLVALLVVGSVAWLMARAFSRPISELQLAVRELSSGDISARVPTAITRRTDELGHLAADFNAMADRLRELMQGREALLREMSHELRSPLARLQATIALAGERGRVPAEESQNIEREIGRMNRVIGEILHYSSLETAVQSSPRLIRVDQLLTNLVADETIEAKAKNCTIRLDCTGDLTLIGDSDLLRSCFENVLRNAIRYAPDDSEITVTAKRDSAAAGEGIVVEISDMGPGVPRENLDSIFEPYFRTATGNHDKDSTGLGLAIVKRVVEQHAGQVTARLGAADTGLIVRIELPTPELT